MKAKKDIYDMDEKYITSNKKGYKIKSWLMKNKYNNNFKDFKNKTFYNFNICMCTK